jgi:heptaprenyl diphosphate synthase
LTHSHTDDAPPAAEAAKRAIPRSPSSARTRIRAVTICAALAAVAFSLSYIENLIPLPIPVPGVKLGFANIATLAALYILGGRAAFAVNILRILLAGLMFTGAFAMFYALSGGILAVIAMILLKRARVFSVVGVSVGGSAAHITGQILLASLIVKNAAIFTSLPLLLISSIIAGAIVGLIVYLLLRALPRAIFRQRSGPRTH